MQSNIQTTSRSSTRCDRCIKLHRKCNRSLPNCQYCEKRKALCTYLTKNIYSKQLLTIEDNISSFKLEGSAKKRVANKAKLQKEKIESKDMHNKGLQLVKSIKAFQNQTVLEIFRSYPDKRSFQNLMTLFQYPSLFSQNENQSVLLDLSLKFAPLVKSQRTLRPHSIPETRRIVNLNLILNKAYESFFMYSNKIFPVLIRSHFDISSKEDPLKMSILLVGLTYMEKSEVTNYLEGYFKSKLRVYLGTPHLIKPTLQNVQAISVLLFYSHSINWVYSQFTNYLAYCAKAIHLLGLDSYSNKIHPHKLLERAMLYSCLTMLQTFIILITGFYLSMPRKPKYLLYQYFNVRVNLAMNNKVMLITKESFDISCKITMCSFYCDLSLIAFHIRLLKESYIACNDDDIRIKEVTTHLLNKIKKVKEHYFTIIIQLGIPSYTGSLNPSIRVYINVILFLCHFLKFFSLSLKFYHPMQIDTSHFSTQFSLENETKYLNEILIECHLTIIYGTKLKILEMFSFGLGIITQCIIFLIRYKAKSSLSFNNTVENGLYYLKQSSKIEIFHTMATININIIEYIKSKYA
ncbi:hypothetical protein K502DRAFT_351075 [Neoconidiobolus thromboides FSU 785]|nr:hypothetical protein K502DRAFT_351075 [Neoconidiobolus thromboides FSU 785]